MLRRLILILAFSVALTGCTTGAPRVYSVWMKCDGGPAPRGAAAEFGQLLLASSTLGIFGRLEMPNARAKLTGDAGVQACTEVLANEALKGNWQRHVNVLRARSIHHMETGNIVAALADVRAIDPVIPESFGGPGGDRGPDLVAKLLEGFVERDRGNHEAAGRLLIEIANARPYSVHVQSMAVKYMPVQAFSWAEGASILDRLVQLEPDALQMRAELFEWDSDADRALADWRALIVAHTPPVIPAAAGEASAAKEKAAGKKKSRRKKSRTQKGREARERKQKANRQEKIERQERTLRPTPVSASILRRASLAAARAGDMDQAFAWLAKARGAPDPLPIFAVNDANYEAISRALSGFKGASADDLMSRLQKQNSNPGAGSAKMDIYASVLEVFGLFYAGSLDLARDRMSQISNYPQTSATLDLIVKLREGNGPDTGSGPLSIDIVKARQGLRAKRNKKALSPEDMNRLFSVLPIYESFKSKKGYSGQWGLGLKSTGFDERQRMNGWLTVEYMGKGVTRTAVEEMTLMRAAELASEAGKPAFLIADRRDYNRYSQTTYNGTPIGPRTLVGFKTEIDVVFVDPADLPAEWQGQGDRILDAEQVWRALAPYYLK